MNFKTLMKSVLMTAVLLGMMSVASFAQIYVSHTNGDNLVGKGTSAQPFQTITKALEVAAPGSVISIAADVYDEAVTVKNPITLVSTTFANSSTVIIKQGLTVDDTTTSGSHIINIGRTADGSKAFNLGVSNPASALVLSKGNVQITTANVTITSGGTITRYAGTLDNPPSVGDVFVVLNCTTDVTAGGEVPPSLGSKDLTVNLTSGKTVTFPNSVSTNGNVYVKSGNVNFLRDLKAFGTFDNSAAGATTTANVSGNMTMQDKPLVSVGTFSVGGDLKLNAGNLTHTGTTFTVGDTLSFTAGSLTNSGKLSVGSSLIESTGSITNTGTLNVTNNIVMKTKDVINNGDGAITVGGSLTFLPSTKVLAGHIINNSTKDITIGGVSGWNFQGSLGTVISNTGKGNITINGLVSFNKGTQTHADETGLISNTGEGTITFAQGIVTNSASDSNKVHQVFVSAVNGAGKILFNGQVNSLTALTNGTGAVVIAGGTVSGPVSNNAGGTIELTANLAYTGTSIDNANSTIKLNGNTVTLSGDVNISNSGKMFATEFGKVGAALLNFTGNGTIATGLSVPNITLASGKNYAVNVTSVLGNVTNNGTSTFTTRNVLGNVTNGGAFTCVIDTVSGNITNNKDFVLAKTVATLGSYTQNTGATLNLATFTMEVKGNWVRLSTVPGDVKPNPATSGKLLFTGSVDQTFTSGLSFEVYDVEVNKTAGVVKLEQTPDVKHDFAITAGKVDLGDNHIRMVGTAKADPTWFNTFKNSGDFYTSTGKGYLIFVGGTNIQYKLSGLGDYSNMDLRGGSTVYAQNNINFSGDLILRNGTLNMDGITDTLTFTHKFVAVPSVTRFIDFGHVTGGVVRVAANTLYDLTYLGKNAAIVPVESEWINAGINNLTVATGDGFNTVQGPGVDIKVAGVVTVNAGQTLDLATKNLTFSNNGLTHTIAGKVVKGNCIVTGDGITVNGSTVAEAEAELPNLSLKLAAANSFTSNNIKKILGAVKVDNGTVNINMNSTFAQIGDSTKVADVVTIGGGDVLLKAGTLTLKMNATTSRHYGGLFVDGGAFNYTRGAGYWNQLVYGTDSLNAGKLTLGSDVHTTGTTVQKDAALDLASYSYYQEGNADAVEYNRYGKGQVTATTGKLALDGGKAAVVADFGTTVGNSIFTVPNMEFVKGTITLKDTVNVTNSLTHTDGVVDLSTLVFSGSTYTYTAGSYSAGQLYVNSAAATVTSKPAVMNIPNLTVNSTGSVTLASGTNNSVSFNVANTFKYVAGSIVTNANNFEINGVFDRTAGTFTQTTGYLVFNTLTADGFKTGDNFAIDNLKVQKSVSTNPTTKVFTVNKNLVLMPSAVLTADAGKLTLGADVLIERQADDAKLSSVPTFGANTSVLYTTTAGINTAANFKELPAAVKNFTVLAPATVVLPTNVTVNSTLKLEGTVTINSTDKKMTMADHATVDLLADARILGANLTKAGDVNVIYEVAAKNTSDRELGTSRSAYDVTVKNNTVTLDNNATIKGQLTHDGGKLEINGKTLTLNGDLNEKTDHTFLVDSYGDLIFAGSKNQTLFLFADRKVKNLTITMQKDAGSNTVTIKKSLDLKSNGIALNSGLLVTEANKVTLDARGTQGYTRTLAVNGMSHIVGNVVKELINTKTDPTVVFPVGSFTSYRPAILTFNPTTSGVSTVPNTILTVSHEATAPKGTVNLPIKDGVKPGVDVNSYAPFFWNIAAEPSTSPSIVFDLELGANGFTAYDDVNDIRIIRRNGLNSDVSNQWLLQGYTSYDSRVVNGEPTIVVRGATAGITSNAIYALGLKTKVSYAVSGKVTYPNAAATGLKDVKVTLTPGNYTATTDANGAFTISNVPNGTYQLAASTTADWMSNAVTAADAQAAAYFSLSPTKYPLPGLQFNAADVNANASVSTQDALQIMRRIVGYDKTFGRGNWEFQTKTVTLTNADASVALQGIVIGDANASASFSGTLAKASVVSDGTIKVAPGAAVSVPVKIDADNVAAVTMKFSYDQKLATFTGISSKMNGLLANDENGEVTLVWADLSAANALSFNSKDNFITLNFKPTENLKAGTSFSVDVKQGEVVNADGKVMSTIFKTASVEASVPSQFALKQNFPNPFNPSTTIQYDLPVAAKVNLVVFNMLGQEVATLVDAVQEAGTQQVQFNAQNLTSGIYFYSIRVSNGDKKFTQTYKMILMK